MDCSSKSMGIWAIADFHPKPLLIHPFLAGEVSVARTSIYLPIEFWPKWGSPYVYSDRRDGLMPTADSRDEESAIALLDPIVGG